MRRRSTAAVQSAWLAGASLAGILLGGCADAPSTLDPRGPRAERVADLSWLIFALGTAVFVVVMAVLLAALLRARRQRPGDPRPTAGNRMIVVGGIVLPALILVALMIVTIRAGAALTEPKEEPALTVEVIGLQFWWEVRYPEHGIITANEIHIPAGRPVRLRVTSADVIHSFWVPQLAGKIDLIPGQTNTIWIEAAEPGLYRGQCAEFCGIQHAKMAFHVVADPPEQFAAWLEAMRQPARPPADATAQRGLQVFFAANCAACHAVRGTEARGTAGPDLTHLMRREWIAAGTLRTNRSNIASWITAAQAIKPGNSMPSFEDLDSESLVALLAYLESLE